MNRDLLELYSDYLLSAFSYATATGLSAVTGGTLSHDKITRFPRGEELDSVPPCGDWSNRRCATSKKTKKKRVS